MAFTMILRKSVVILSIALLMISGITIFEITSTSIADEYINGDWIITSEEHYDNETYVVTGDIIIENGGKLYLDNVTIKMNILFDNQFEINVKYGGELYAKFSNFTSNHPEMEENRYSFKVNGTLELRYNELSYTGLAITSDAVMIDTNYFFSCGTGIYIVEASPTIINPIITNSGTGIGMYYYASPIIINPIITSNSGWGILINHWSSPFIEGGTISYNGGDGIDAGPECYVNISNTTISYNGADGGYGVESRGGSVVTLINCTINDNVYGNYDYDPGSTIIRQNWLDLRTIDSNSNQPIPNARVLINNTYGDTVYDGYTDSDGWLRNVNLTHKILGNGSGTFTPHNITISKDNYFANWTEVMMNESHKVTVELTPHPVPTPYTVYGRVEETAGMPAAGANISCLAPGFGRVETNTDADGYFYLNLGSIPGYVANIGDIVHIDVEHSAGSMYGVERILDGSPPQDLGIFELGELNITLRLGWNLFALPGNVGGWEMKEMCESLEAQTSFYILSVSWYSSGMWKDYLWRDGTPPNHLLDGNDGYANLHNINNVLVKLGRGYMLYLAGSGADPKWEIPIAGLEAAIETSFNQGWTLLAAPYHTGLTVTADDILSQINAQNGGAGACTKVCNWTVTDTWETWDGSVGDDFLLDDGNNPNNANAKAWAVYATKSGSWTPL